MLENVNLLAITVSALFYFFFGGLWYGLIFGKSFVCSLGISSVEEESRSKKLKNYLLVYLINGFFISTAFSILLSISRTNTLSQALGITLLIFFGLIFPLSLNCFCFEKRPLKIFIINIGNYLISLFGITLIIHSLK